MKGFFVEMGSFKNFMLTAAVALAAAGCVDENAVENNAETSYRPIKLIAHRGESIYAPENTQPSYELAWKNGVAWGAETDVYLTKDNVLVCMHDHTTDRTTGVPGVIREMTFEEIRKLDAGKFKGAQWQGTKVPSLREIFSTVPRDKHIFVEVKSAGEGFADAYEAARLAGGVDNDQVTIISFNENELINVRKSLPHVRTLWLWSLRKNEQGEVYPSAEEVIAKLRRLDLTGADFYPGDGLWLDAEYVQKIHDAGFEMHAWTINTVDTAIKLYDNGVDSITTDCSGRLFKEMTNVLESRTAAQQE